MSLRIRGTIGAAFLTDLVGLNNSTFSLTDNRGFEFLADHLNPDFFFSKLYEMNPIQSIRWEGE